MMLSDKAPPGPYALSLGIGTALTHNIHASQHFQAGRQVVLVGKGVVCDSHMGPQHSSQLQLLLGLYNTCMRCDAKLKSNA